MTARHREGRREHRAAGRQQHGLERGPAATAGSPSSAGHAWDRAAAAAVIALYVLALWGWRDSVPPGLANDAAEEVLRGVTLLDTRTLTPITTVLGRSAETGSLYLSALAFRALGGGTLPVQLVSWIFAILTIVLFVATMRRLEPRLPAALTAALAAGSLWLFHYARSGLRASAAPVVTLAVAWALDRLRTDEADRRAAVGTGAAAAAGLYAYTACRVLPVALALAVGAWVLAGGRPERSRRVRVAGWMGLSALVVSLPNLVYAITQPAEFFGRGAYVLRDSSAVPSNVFWSAMLPFHYPAVYNLVSGPGWFFDGVSVGLARTGVSPVSPWIGAAAALGAVTLARRWREPAIAFLLAVWVVALAVLGPSGPSLTRWLVVLPVILAAAAIGLGAVARWIAARGWLSLRGAGWVLAGLLLVAAAWQGAEYVTRSLTSPGVAIWFARAATPIGARAAELARQGRPVTCVLTKDASVVRLLTHGVPPGAVEIVEFWGRPADMGEVLSADTARRAFLIENASPLRPLTAALAAGRPAIDRGRFIELPPPR